MLGNRTMSCRLYCELPATSTSSFVVSLYEVQCGTLSSAERSVWTLIFKEALLLLMLAYDGCWKTNSRRPFSQTICVAYRDFVHNVKTNLRAERT